jgi:hypothetical protein
MKREKNQTKIIEIILASAQNLLKIGIMRVDNGATRDFSLSIPEGWPISEDNLVLKE